jgi:LysR family glycine cleavage system transcriptional activator
MHVPPHHDVRLPPLTAIQAFEAAARLGSFERASEALFITASAVGKRVAVLEATLGVGLFIRSGRGLTLSVAGKEYLEQVRAALDLLSNASLHRRSVRRKEPLRVVSTPTFARQILVPRLGGFTRRFPGIGLELLLSIPYLEVGPPYADLQIRFGSGRYPGMVAEQLTDEPVFAVCSPDYLARTPWLATPALMPRADLLRCPLEPWRPWFEAAGLDGVDEPTHGVRLFDLGMMLEASRAGLGVALGRHCLIDHWMAESRLVRLFDVSFQPESNYFLCRDASRPVDEAIEAFSHWLLAECGQLRVPLTLSSLSV